MIWQCRWAATLTLAKQVECWMTGGAGGARACTHVCAAVRVPVACYSPHDRRSRGACRGRPTRCACCRLLVGTCGTAVSRGIVRTITIQVGSSRCLPAYWAHYPGPLHRHGDCNTLAGQAMPVCWACDACLCTGRPFRCVGCPAHGLSASTGFTAGAPASVANPTPRKHRTSDAAAQCVSRLAA